MYPVSNAFMEMINSNARKYYWTGSILTKTKKEYDFENADILKGSGYITRQCCGNSEIELGSVYAAEMGITLFSDIDRYTLEGGEIRLYFHLDLGNGTEECIPMGVFEISEANRNIKTLEIKGYDYMLRFDKNLALTSSSGTPYQYLKFACDACKVELKQTETEINAMPNGKETLGIYTENDMETYRDLLYYVTQVLGGVCQITRDGKLEVCCYSKNADTKILSKHRYSSSYSDFVTRYTAVSSTNMKTEKAEYYALEKDDGLTLNLGVNPLLQFGRKKTREKILRRILDSVTAVEYVPFDSDTIGNPALDPIDVITFSGGHADASKVSCITSITYKINGKHSLKCVGKNPRLAGAKSKTDKNIAGLLNQVESGKVVVYSFINVAPITVGPSPVEAMALTFTAKENTSASFWAEILLDVKAESQTEALPVFTAVYKMNGIEADSFYPTETYTEGKHVLTLFYPIAQVVENSENTLALLFKISGGSAEIGASQIRASITGQGLVASQGQWNGRIEISEKVGRLPIEGKPITVASLKERVAVNTGRPKYPKCTETLKRISLEWPEFSYDGLTERVAFSQVVTGFSVNAVYPPAYDKEVVFVNENGGFQMKDSYELSGEQQEVDFGKLQSLRVDTDKLESVKSLEVSI